MRRRIRAAGALVALLAPIAPAVAQSLKGSPASINRMYRQARAEKLSFYQTSSQVRRAISSGRLVRLVPNGHFTLHEVSFPYVRSATKTFVERLAPQYENACNEPLQVTSAVRPESRQPSNSVERSVHPTGMAIDLHKPERGSCRKWLRETLLELEGTGVLEATEEFSPPHFHVAIYQTPYRKYVAARLEAQNEQRVAQAGKTASSTVYVVRRGDTLWDIARAHDTTVDAIRDANRIDGAVIQPGDELVIPRS